MLGTCPKCGLAVFDDSRYYYDPDADEYWHEKCLPKSDEGFQ